jgi:mono/diheme cytochrome c family protein
MFLTSLKGFTLLITLLSLSGCPASFQEGTSKASISINSAGELIEKGKRTYQTQCIACHNIDPKKAGSIGPEVHGSSKELLEARILRGEYPPGYQQKRKSRFMVPLPHLKNEIDSLHAYLNSN